ncbi:MAG: serine/threonine protein phosphatase [Anaerolineae bacterium]|nr:serine/threonine protein phosphatase [Anaerolineae bacterium]
MSAIYAIGDIHGHYEKLVKLLCGAGLINEQVKWSGSSKTLCFMGDFVDRGPDGVGTVELVMRLQSEAAEVGGRVLAVMGNHDLYIPMVQQYPDAVTEQGFAFRSVWLRNGGLISDLEDFTTEQIHWLANLPVMLLVGDKLIIHADSLLYTNYGKTVDEVNQAVATLFAESDLPGIGQLMKRFATREAFLDSEQGVRIAADFLATYGGSQIIHGHTPITTITGQPSSEITEPLVYANGLCVNIDGGMYMGGSGFVHIIRS